MKKEIINKGLIIGSGIATGENSIAIGGGARATKDYELAIAVFGSDKKRRGFSKILTPKEHGDVHRVLRKLEMERDND